MKRDDTGPLTRCGTPAVQRLAAEGRLHEIRVKTLEGEWLSFPEFQKQQPPPPVPARMKRRRRSLMARLGEAAARLFTPRAGR